MEAARAAAAALELVPLPPCVYIAVGASHPPAVQQLYRRMFGGALDNEAADAAEAEADGDLQDFRGRDAVVDDSGALAAGLACLVLVRARGTIEARIWLA